MILTGHIADRISKHLNIPIETDSQDLQELYRQLIIDHNINVVHLLTDRGSITFDDPELATTTSGKLAQVLNMILIDHFDSVQEFFSAFGTDHDTIIDLWGPQLRRVKYSTLRSLINIWGVSTTHLYATKASPFRSSKTQKI